MSIVDEAESEGRLIRRWSHGGLECAMAHSPMHGVNGYVRVPAGVDAQELVDAEALDACVTWGPDADGWVGFDTAHGWDLWWDPDVPESRLERALREVDFVLPRPPVEWMNVWTLEKVEAEVVRLADEVRAAMYPEADNPILNPNGHPDRGGAQE